MLNVITIGDSTIDNYLVIDNATVECDLNKKKCRLCFNYADKIPIKTTSQSVGGNAANVAVGLRQLGLKTAIVTELGDDINGHVIKHEFEETGVATNLVKLLPNRETRYSVVLNYQSERTILSYYAERNYSLPVLPNTEWIYYTSLGKSFEKLQTKLANYLKRHPNTKLELSPGSYQMKQGLATVRNLIPRSELIIVNKEEATRLLGKRGSPKALAETLHKQGARLVVITDGENGSFASDGFQAYNLPVYPITPVAKTGAGDAYASGFLAAIIYGKTLPEAMQWGTANAGGVIQKWGAQHGLLTKKQIVRTVLQYSSILPVRIRISSSSSANFMAT